jgi:hypothetical protein
MPSKKYPSTTDRPTAREPVVKEAKAQAYGRKREHGQDTRAASMASVKRRLKKPVKRSKPDIAWALDIVGIGAGPVDLSERAREYLYGNK